MLNFIPDARLDPAPFAVLESETPSSMLVVCDHASPVIPLAHGNLGLSETDRLSHVAWDIGAAQVAHGLSRRLRCPAVLAGVSRLVIDCNRRPGDPSSIPAVSCGVAVPGNHSLDEDEAADRAERWFWPYHRQISAQLTRLRRFGAAPAVVSVHSFTPVMNGCLRPWHVGVLWNRDPRMAVPLLKALGRQSGLVVGDNQPYSGREINHTLDTHAGAAGLPHLSFEIRQDLIADAAGAESWAALLAEVLAPVMAEPKLFQVARY
jgi:predicted N-formylglutamate amidohydrolase